MSNSLSIDKLRILDDELADKGGFGGGGNGAVAPPPRDFGAKN